ncbi:MAG: Peptidase [Candidatus Tokpelaia hoelldobleri]|uniref:Peptidase n=1 Tax=Candidatus Tokpelaia hoelldobleri TaxID=1902579 RepID=A0A1U9JVC5_9HYPH|nr:MAG: Peptidase [Candidatus Tokpelaia hoelldoblerii]
MKQNLARQTKITRRFGAMSGGVVFACFVAAHSLSQVSQEDAQAHIKANQALGDVQNSISLSRERAAGLVAEVAKLQKDKDSLNTALVAAAKAERALSADIREREGRLQVLMVDKLEAEKNLHIYSKDFARALSIAERIGRNPPPAMLVHPQDALQSVRSAALLGAIVPEMQGQMQVLSNAFQELDSLTQSVAAEQTEFAAAVEARKVEQERLSLLIAEKAKLQQKSEEELAAEKAQMAELVKQARSLQELLAALDRQAEKNGSSLRLQVRTNFAALQGQLLLPVDGQLVKAFNPSTQGETYETPAGAIVTSPVEGIVRYAGAFRSYGQMLIIDAGHDYHLVLAGMGRIDVAQGQILLQGEPVGAMETQLVASTTTLGIGKKAPMLYIELRKDGKPVNPARWWVHR